MGRHSQIRRTRLVRWWVIALVSLGVVIMIGSQVIGRDSSAAGSGTCGTLRVATAPALAETVRDQAKALGDDCHRFSVQSMEPQAFAATVTKPQDRPQVWIPDSTLWVESLTRSMQSRKITVQLTPRGTVATSPVVLAVPRSLASPKTTGVQPYAAAVAGLPLTASSPNESTSTVLTYAAVYQSLRSTPAGQQAMATAFFQVIRYAVPPSALLSLAEQPADRAKAFPASEQQIFAYNAAHRDSHLSALVPASGPPELTYTFTTVGSLNPTQTEQADRLYRQLRGQGRTALQQDGFRTEGKTPASTAGIPATLPGSAPDTSVADFDQLRVDWARLSQDLQLLIALDVSGSMTAKAGSSTRIQLAAETLKESVSQMPATSEAGLWVFSTDQRPGVDYRELSPVEPLGTISDPSSHVNQLLGLANRLPSLVGGDTGLYDTIWAAYSEQQRTYQPGLESLVVVVTDGKNDDPHGGLSAEQLIAKITQVQDDQRPVRVVLIGMGPDADEQAMRRITTAIGGTTSVATDPTQLTEIFANAVWKLSPDAWS